MIAVRYRLAALALCLAAAGCGGGDFSSAVGDAKASEQARLKLVDQCMFDRSLGGDPMDRTRGPRCQCYARTAAKQMSPAEAATFVASGAMPLSVKTADVMTSCRRG